MQQVINLCSDDEIQPNNAPEEAGTIQCERVIEQTADGDVNIGEMKEGHLKQETHLANGTSAQQKSVHWRAQRHKNKKLKREQKRQQDLSDEQDGFSDDEKLRDIRSKITEAKQEVQCCEEKLRQASIRLESLECQVKQRRKHLRHQADETFNWLGVFPWRDRLLYQLHFVFRLNRFRPFQHEALNATLLKRDVFAILPTGAGKSLIYQLAAVVDRGLTLVVTPLLSLSMDQRMALSRLNIRAESIDSITPKEKVRKIYNELLPNKGKVPGSEHPRKRRMRGQEWIQDDMKPAILFVTPEQVAKSKRLMHRLEGMHENGHLSRICIDEAHCASLWGHDFRIEYRKLGILRRQLPDAPILSLTATCSQKTKEDVCKILETKDSVVFRGSIDRPNLFYEVREKGSNDKIILNDILGWITGEFADMCGIIYVLAKKDAFSYAEWLREAGVKAGCYHGDLERQERNTIHAAWSDGRIQVVVATIAFGLGIDNPRVRFVIHATMATSLEGYYQESGRAGRDGKPAKCVLLHRAKEFPKMSGFVADKGGSRLRQMYEMYQYASSRGLDTLCRRAVIAQAFGEMPPDRKDKASCCDVCAGRSRGSYELVAVDVTELARSVGRIVLRGAMDRPDEKVTLLAVASDWANTGAKGKRVRGDEKAIARGICIDTRVEILVELVLLGILEEYHRHSNYSVNAYVTSGEKAGQVFDGDRITIVVAKKNAVKLVKEGCRIVGGVGDWQNIGRTAVIEEETLDGGDADNHEIQRADLDHEEIDHGVMDHVDMDHEDMDHEDMDHEDIDHEDIDHESMDHKDNDEKLDGDDTDGECVKEELVIDGENKEIDMVDDQNRVDHQQNKEEDQLQEDDEEQSDEEAVRRKRRRM